MNEILKEVEALIENSPDHAISYSTYMETVLYHPTLGYYNRMKPKVGKAGDFITSVSVNSVYAKVMADCFYHYIKEQKLPMAVCEIGGADGGFAYEVIQHFKMVYPEAYENLSYILIEQSPYHRKIASHRLESEEKVTFFHSLNEAIQKIPQFQGIIFSNELFDALPVYEVTFKSGKWEEIKITYTKEQGLKEICVPIQDQLLVDFISKYKIHLNDSQRFELPITMTEVVASLSNWLRQGTMITVDYGYETDVYQQPELAEGSLRGYYQHQLVTNPLLHPGEMDLTTHVPLAIFDKACYDRGFVHVDTSFQGEFLYQSGIFNYLQEDSGRDPFSEVAKRNRAIKSFVLGEFNRSFYVMIHQKE